MIRNKLVENISANTIQFVINQVLGVVIFFEVSKQLDKGMFGHFNWALAVLLTSFAILSFGLDQITVKKIATGSNASVISSYLLHVFIAGLSFYGILLTLCLVSPSFYHKQQFLLLLGCGKLLNFFSTPFKQAAMGLERFRLLMFMSIGSTVVKATGLFVFSFLGDVSVYKIIFIFVAADLVELLVCVLISLKYLRPQLNVRFKIAPYLSLVKEALPQLGTVIFSTALARVDWILLGILASATRLAEYSFAYKAFEISTLPLLIIAPLLIPMFSRLFRDTFLHRDKIKDLESLLTIELIFASLIGLMVNILWAPVIDSITGGKYGAVNTRTIFILSLSIPLLYFNNFFWTINFSKGRLRKIFVLFAITFAVNLSSNLLLIPSLNSEGAAMAYVLALSAQSIGYIKITKVFPSRKPLYSLLICPVCALAAGFISVHLLSGTLLMLFSSILLYLVFIVLSKQLSFVDYKFLKRELSFS
jgi:O-antigen/teichoic acid export membrane protein